MEIITIYGLHLKILNRMIIGDDGGAQVTYDGGETWSTYYNQPTSQFYRVTTDNAFSVSNLCSTAR